MRIIEAELAQINGALKVARHILEFLTGIPIEAERLEEEDLEGQLLSSDLDELVQGIETRADVLAAEQAVKTARGGVVVAQSDLWPVISLENNNYVHREGFQSGTDWDLLLTFDVPLFRGGGTIGKIKESLSVWKKAKLSHSLAKRQAELEVKEAYQSWASSVDQSKALELAVREAEENYNLQKEDYTHSLVNNLDVLEALEELFRTRRDANQTYYQMKQNYWRLKVALGEAL
jgi:outer membrane protein TolC